ncbi:CsbD family protein [Sphingobium sp. CCH11-B1]|uniref:CsbD family protein n=1 Tax=Sphingobium sp. CCH11-B1 TaxID=1768781 RepID=UPI00082DFE1E|nr:hypothetical protein [Sphingobium sp. CCH11-B1]
MNKHQIHGNWKIISGKIQRIWAESLGDYRAAMHGNLREIAGQIQKEFGLAREEAEQAIEKWREQELPTALLKEQWDRFDLAMRDQWDVLRIRRKLLSHELEDKRQLVIGHAEELVNRFAAHYKISEDDAARQVNDWLTIARSWLAHPSLNNLRKPEEKL